MDCEIKSKYLGSWEIAQIDLDPEEQSFRITRVGKSKLLPIREITRCQITSLKNIERILLVEVGARRYQIKGTQIKLKKIADVYRYWQYFQNYTEITEEKMQKPKAHVYKSVRTTQQKCQILLSKEQSKSSQKQPPEPVEYENFYRLQDWRRDAQEGGLLFINQQKKDMQPKIIKFLISKFLSTGSFMGISFPVFAMKPESILQTYCRCISLAPRLMTGLKNPIQRMKAYNCLILSLSIRFTDLDKSFNPVLGQTFQAFVDGCQIFAEQVSHHPPISAFTLIGEDFKLHAHLQVQASMGFNSARGRFYGNISVEYDDGGQIIGRMPCGILSGYLFGRYVFLPDGACYCYDPINQLVCSYSVDDRDVMKGFIGKLNHKAAYQFTRLVGSTDEDLRQERYENFQHIDEKKFEKIYSRMTAQWSRAISYDGRIFIDFEDPSWKPPKLSSKLPQPLLPSDSRHRKDIQLRTENMMDESQTEKQRIQNEQRSFKKLRMQANPNDQH